MRLLNQEYALAPASGSSLPNTRSFLSNSLTPTLQEKEFARYAGMLLAS